MLRRTNYGLWVDDDGKPNKNELAIDYIVESARSVGIEVIEGKTALDIQFMAEVMKRLREKQEPCEDCISRQIISDYVGSHIQEINTGYGDLNKHTNEILRMIVDYIESIPPVTPKPKTEWIPVSEKYEHHIDHTDCIWYGNDSGCPVTCSQYRDGWNDAMDYIFKNGDGYRPYRRNENG